MGVGLFLKQSAGQPITSILYPAGHQFPRQGQRVHTPQPLQAQLLLQEHAEEPVQGQLEPQSQPMVT